MEKMKDENKRILKAGIVVQVLVFIAAFITGAGGIAYLVSSGKSIHNYSTFNGVAPFLKSAGGIAKGVLSLNCEAIMQLGVLVLIAIPLIRVTVFLFSFIRERDWIYLLISVIVMGILLFSITG